MQVEKRKKFIVNVLYWAAIIGIVYIIFKYLVTFLMPFFIAALIAVITRPLAQLLAKKCHIKLSIAALFCTVICFLIALGLVVLAALQLISWGSDLFSALPSIYSETIAPELSRYANELVVLASRFDEEVVEFINTISPQLITSVGNAATTLSEKVLSFGTSIITGLPGFLLSAVICVIASVFVALDFEKIESFLSRQLPEKVTRVISQSGSNFRKILWKYIKSYGLIMLITFVEIAAGLLIIGINNAVLIAVLIAVFDIFPIVGSGLILLPWTVITFIQGNLIRGIGLGILYVVVIVVRQIMEPKIIGRHVGLHPLVTLICMFVGAHLFGGIGLFGVPITAAVIKSLDDGGVINIFVKEPEEAPSPDAEEPAPDAEAPSPDAEAPGQDAQSPPGE